MIRRLASTCVLACALFPAAAVAQTGTAVCYATADTRLEQKAPATNYGTATRANFDKLWASCISGSIPGQLAEAMLKFNLTDPAACNLPAGAVVNAVRFKVNVGDASVDRFGLYQMRKSWTEAGATWSSAGTGAAWQVAGANGTTSPGQDRNATLLASLSNQPTGLRSVPLNTAGRDAVRGWQRAPSTNHGVLLRSHVGDPVTSCDDSMWISSRETASRPRLEIDWKMPDATTPITGSTFKIVSWNMHYGKGMTTKAPGMSCPLPGLKDNAQCQIADHPATLINEREEERRQSAWGVGLTQRYLTGPMVLGDPEVIALLLTEVNSQACFSQADLLAVVRRQWPNAVISPAHRDNWIVARWGFVRGTTNYGQRDVPPCGFQSVTAAGTPVSWPSSYAEGVQWGKIYAQDPDPDRDGVLLANPRTIDVFNAHWPLSGTSASGDKFFCTTNASITRDFMNSPATGVDLSRAPRILGGDFNAEDLVRLREVSLCEPYGGRAGYDLLRQAGFADTFTAPGASKLTPTVDGSTGMVGRPTDESCYRNFSHNGPYMPYKRIDFQWSKGGAATGQNLRVLDFELIGVEQFGNCVPSDHMGSKVRYEWY
jgi:hypothetical protein